MVRLSNVDKIQLLINLSNWPNDHYRQRQNPGRATRSPPNPDRGLTGDTRYKVQYLCTMAAIRSPTTQYKLVPKLPIIGLDLYFRLRKPFMKELLRFDPPFLFYPFSYWIGCTVLQFCSWVQPEKFVTLIFA